MAAASRTSPKPNPRGYRNQMAKNTAKASAPPMTASPSARQSPATAEAATRATPRRTETG